MLLIYTICFLLFLPIFSTYFVVHCIIHMITFLYSPCEYTYMCTHTHTCVYVTHTCVYIHTCVHTQTFIYGHTPVCIYTHVCAHTQTCVYVHTCIYVHVCLCVCTYTQRHTCAYATERLICHCTQHIPLEWLLEKRQYAFLKLSHSVIKCTITCIMEEHIPV